MSAPPARVARRLVGAWVASSVLSLGACNAVLGVEEIKASDAGSAEAGADRATVPVSDDTEMSDADPEAAGPADGADESGD